jgi:hypothetical protein
VGSFEKTVHTVYTVVSRKSIVALSEPVCVPSRLSENLHFEFPAGFEPGNAFFAEQVR